MNTLILKIQAQSPDSLVLDNPITLSCYLTENGSTEVSYQGTNLLIMIKNDTNMLTAWEARYYTGCNMGLICTEQENRR